MAGMRIARTDGAGWTVETVDLILTRRCTTRRAGSGLEPLGDGAQLRVTRNGHLIAYCLSPHDLPALGVDMSRMAVVARWLADVPPWRHGPVPRRRTKPATPLLRRAVHGKPVTASPISSGQLSALSPVSAISATSPSRAIFLYHMRDSHLTRALVSAIPSRPIGPSPAGGTPVSSAGTP